MTGTDVRDEGALRHGADSLGHDTSLIARYFREEDPSGGPYNFQHYCVWYRRVLQGSWTSPMSFSPTRTCCQQPRSPSAF